MIIEELAEWLYNQTALELASFIDEYKVPVRKPRDWKNKPDKQYWYGKAEELEKLLKGNL